MSSDECEASAFGREADRLESQAERMLIRAQEIREQAMVVADLVQELDDLEPENLIFFRKQFRPGGKVFTYGAVKYEEVRWPGGNCALWATTGPKAPKGYTTQELCEWLVGGLGVEELWTAAEYERVL